MMSSRQALCATAAAAILVQGLVPAMAQEQVSRPGVYSGYSPVLYDGYKLTSQYVAMRDGTRIALDIYRPTLNGVVVETPLPVVWMNSPYARRKGNEGGNTPVQEPPAIGLVRYGYVIAVADMRGNYASFGKAVQSNRTEWSPDAYWDAYDMTEWLARQPWSIGKVGMAGCSALGHAQWQAAVSHPPHLVTVFPQSAPSEYYDWGGIAPTAPDPDRPYPGNLLKAEDRAVPVDEDTDGKLLAAAREEHRYGTDWGWVPYRDSVAPDVAKHLGVKNFRPGLDVNTLEHFAELNRNPIPAYQSLNWGEDQRVKLGVMVKMHNFTGPMKTIMAPGDHCNWSTDARPNAKNPFNATVEQHRWFDYWLKGINNGIMDQPPITLYTYNRPQGHEWTSAWQWPLPTARAVPHYLGAGAAGTPRGGVNSGSLSLAVPTRAGAKDVYTTDYSIDAATRDAKGLVYTTAPLVADTALIGHPVVNLWITSTAKDADIAAYLADVGPDGKVTPLPGTDDGRLRASHRALNTPPYNNLGLPYHRSFAADVKPLVPGQPTRLEFDMAPISWVFRAGHSIRLTVAASVEDRHRPGKSFTPEITPTPVLQVLRDPAHPSSIVLPVNSPLKPALAVAGNTARLTFPASLNRHYLADLKPGAIMAGAVAARSVRLEGSTIVAEFPAGSLKPGTAVTGRFGGGTYDYGDMAFAAAVR
ncbi:CocE/NonD family hydrolase [Novosphingobium flavum]|nr:CocE/NonD family hydrolase [Novosphingobium flavum]